MYGYRQAPATLVGTKGDNILESALIFWRKSIFTRLMLTFLLIVSPLYLVAFLIYNWGIGSVKEELERTMKSQVAFFTSNLNTEVQRINSLLYNTLYDSNLTDLADTVTKMSDYEIYRSINNLQQRLLVLKNSNLYVKDVTAYIPSAEMFVTSNEGVGNVDPDALAFFNRASTNSKSQLLQYRGDFYLRALLPLDMRYRMEKKVHLLTATLSIDRIRASLGQLDTRPGGGTALLLPDRSLVGLPGADEQLAAALGAALQALPDLSGSGSLTFAQDGQNYFAVYETSSYLGATLAVYVHQEALTEKADRFKGLFLVYSMAAVLIVFVYMLSAFKFVQQPMLKLIRALRQMEKGNLNVEITHRSEDEYGFVFTRFNGMVRNLNQLIDQVYKQQILTQQAELKQLQSQINPHFLYNTYFVLYNMAMSEDYDNVKQFTRQLGTYFQFITRNAADDVPLKMEVEHARTYCEIQSLRFWNRLAVDFGELPASCSDTLVPRLILQPILENVFEHGLADKKADGLLTVAFDVSAAGLEIVVEDNGPLLPDSVIVQLNEKMLPGASSSETTAIVNINRRLRLKFGDGSGLVFRHGAEGGLQVRIVIA
ncbi:sensor histidine kinase [Paenibacillus nasutitermitis]|uniref:Histidine kinase n=1 Tax=Paenibacillus nasutitermitis TaxID=1652958 RepID=A0A916ZAW7_9BACL|nr:histidine kinase [Paenibacillus nasutitermitis]GGD84991.1 histidine kinase [Paenibacillus nasutitermitis]